MAYPKTTAIEAVNDIFAHTGVKSVPAGGYTLAAAVTGTVKRGTPLKRGATAKELVPVAAAADEIVAIAAATVDTTITKAMPAFEEGEFNARICGALLPAEVTVAQVYAKATTNGIYFRDVVAAV